MTATRRPQGITILGATGSIGVNTLDVIAQHPERYRVIALTAHRQIDRLLKQCQQFSPRFVVVADELEAQRLQPLLTQVGLNTEVLYGACALEWVATLPEVDSVMAAIVGAAGLRSTLAAARAGKRILLANKESLVMAGPLFIEAVEQGGATLLPVDSEHSAIFQALPPSFERQFSQAGISRLILTASGGPFRQRPADSFAAITPEEACQHPNWKMGRKISVDSATLMNKGLEVIEAHCLFGAPIDKIEVVIHPQSVIHSMVAYQDGSIMAQMGLPDMRTPIACALAWPERIVVDVPTLDFTTVSTLTFEPPDLARFPCLNLAFSALRAGGDAPVVLNAANEMAVEAFLNCAIRFGEIPQWVERSLATLDLKGSHSVDDLFEKDRATRRFFSQWINCR